MDISEHRQLGKQLNVGTKVCVACQASWILFPGGSIETFGNRSVVIYLLVFVDQNRNKTTVIRHKTCSPMWQNVACHVLWWLGCSNRILALACVDGPWKWLLLSLENSSPEILCHSSFFLLYSWVLNRHQLLHFQRPPLKYLSPQFIFQKSKWLGQYNSTISEYILFKTFSSYWKTWK